MNLVCRSIFALLAIYVLYSECITLPTIIKKNKKLLYFLIGGLYLYTFDNVEGLGGGTIAVIIACCVFALLAAAALWCPDNLNAPCLVFMALFNPEK